MDWKVLALLIIVSLVVLVIVVLGIMLQQAIKKQNDLNLQVDFWKGKYKTSKETIKRLLDQIKAGELTDEEAIKKANRLLDNWSVINSSIESD